MEELLGPEVEQYELVVSLENRQAAEGVVVECAKCGATLIAVAPPKRKPACEHCWEIISGLKTAAAKGFRVGF